MNSGRAILLSAWLLGGLAVGVQSSITPYLWGTNTAVDLSFRGRNVGSDDIIFSDLVDKLDSAFMVHVEAARGQWGRFVDLTYLEISDRDRPQFVTIDSSSTQVYLDAAMAF